MEYITLKNSDLQVSRLCMGGCPMGGYGWGQVDERELIAAVRAALDRGVNFFDTADTYGLGQSERTLGKALGARRPEAVIATKFGVRIENGKTFYDNSPQWIRRACEESLKRLDTEYIDLYQVHYRDKETPMAAVVETLEQLRAEGKIRYFGLSNQYRGDLQELQPWKGTFSSFQNQYSLACRDYETDILELSGKLDMTPMTWGSLGQGILTGKYDENVRFGSDDRRSRKVYVNFYGEKLKKNLTIVERLRQEARNCRVPVSAAAVRFILDYIPGSVVLCGAKRPEQILETMETLTFSLEPEALRRLEEVSR